MLIDESLRSEPTLYIMTGNMLCRVRGGLPACVMFMCMPALPPARSGWVAAIKAIHYSWLIGVFFIASAGLWTGAIGLCVMMIVRVCRAAR
jgi:hypothetical protein